MKLHLAQSKNRNSFTGYGAGYVAVNGTAYRAPLLVTPETIVADWPVADLAELTADALHRLLAHAPEIIILGTGATQRFPDPALLRPLLEARIGVEIMATPAGCRTYNILAAEERRVLAAMWLP